MRKIQPEFLIPSTKPTTKIHQSFDAAVLSSLLAVASRLGLLACCLLSKHRCSCLTFIEDRYSIIEWIQMIDTSGSRLADLNHCIMILEKRKYYQLIIKYDWPYYINYAVILCRPWSPWLSIVLVPASVCQGPHSYVSTGF